MTELLYILEQISLPIILLILTGFVFQKIFKTDVRTYSKLLIYLLIPIVIFVKIIKSDFTWELVLTVTVFVLMLEIAMYIISQVLSRIFGYPKSMRNAMTNALVLFNTGNYGIPLIDLVFAANPLASASQLFIVIIQNITTNTFGVYQVSSGKATRRQALKTIARMPALYVMALAMVVRLTGFQIPNMVMIPLDYLSNAFIALALMTLGVQLADVKLTGGLNKVMLTSAVKVIGAPLLGFAFVLLLGIKGMLAQALVIGISTPTAVNSAMLAQEFDNEPAYAAKVVVATTAMCTVTLPAVIYFVQQYFVL